MSTFFSNRKGCCSSKAAKLSPHTLPLQCVIGLPDWKLQNKKIKKRRKNKRIETGRQFCYKIKHTFPWKNPLSLSSLFTHEPMLFLSKRLWSERNHFSFWFNSAPAKRVSPNRCTLPHLAPMKNILNWVNMVSETTICLSKTTFNIKNVKKKNVVAFLYGKNKDNVSRTLSNNDKSALCTSRSVSVIKKVKQIFVKASCDLN